jgi:hypothetical protein
MPLSTARLGARSIRRPRVPAVDRHHIVVTSARCLHFVRIAWSLLMEVPLHTACSATERMQTHSETPTVPVARPLSSAATAARINAAGNVSRECMKIYLSMR